MNKKITYKNILLNNYRILSKRINTLKIYSANLENNFYCKILIKNLMNIIKKEKNKIIYKL